MDSVELSDNSLSRSRSRATLLCRCGQFSPDLSRVSEDIAMKESQLMSDTSLWSKQEGGTDYSLSLSLSLSNYSINLNLKSLSLDMCECMGVYVCVR